jgi:sRNA-binding protein
MEQWLEETFPHLFAADDYMALDHLILCDLKNDYRNNFLKRGYPQDLVIKEVLNRYKESYGYLWSLKEGAARYNLKGDICGIVTKEEEKVAKKILETL